jgi:1-acyl-sn-glycerol-3-phosphate acyltransferase
MSLFSPDLAAKALLSALNVRLSFYDRHRIPQDLPVIVVSNHRSFLDAAVLIATLPFPLRIACHHYMGKTPIIREIVNSFGCFPLDKPPQRQQQFFRQASNFLAAGEWVGLFPEGAKPMVEPTSLQTVGEFQRGFAHLAWKVPISLVVLPVAIAALDETIYSTIPVNWLHYLDNSEPLFQRDGLHPMVVYHRVNVAIGQPYPIYATTKQQYRGKQGKQLALDLTEYCRQEIITLLSR